MAVFKVLKNGQTDISSTDKWRFAINSDCTNVKIKYSGSGNFVLPAGDYDAYYTINHNLGYIPIVFGWVERSGKIYPCNLLTGINDVLFSSDPADICTVMAICLADTSNIYIGVHNKFPVDAPAYDNYSFKAHYRIAVDNY